MTRTKGIVKEDIINDIISMIIQGTLNEGDFLPSIRSMSSRYNVSRGTVLVIYKHLEAMGYIQGFERSGYLVVRSGFYASQPSLVPADPAIPYQPLSHDSPQYPLTKLMQRRPCKLPPHFIKRWNSNYTNLSRHADSPSCAHLQRFLKLSRGVDIDEKALLLCSGYQEALTLIALFLQQQAKKRVIITEDPCSPKIHALFSQLAFDIIPVATDSQGLCVDQLPTITDATLLCMPSLQYPTAARMSEKRKQQLCRWAITHRILIIEDDSHAMLGFGKNLSPPLFSQSEELKIIYLTQLDEVLGTTYNLAILALPAPYREPVSRLNQVLSSTYPPSSFYIIESFLTSSYLMKYLTALIEERYKKAQIAKKICTERISPLSINFHGECGFCYFSAQEADLPSELINTAFFPVTVSAEPDKKNFYFLFPYSLMTLAELEKIRGSSTP